jgi:hypothetical protein
MRFALTFLVLSLLLSGCSHDAKLSKKILGTWMHEGTNTQGTATFTNTTIIAPDGTFSYLRIWNERPLTNTFAGTWQIREGFMFMTLTNRSGPNPQVPPGAIIKCRIIRLDDHEFVCETDGITNISSR